MLVTSGKQDNQNQEVIQFVDSPVVRNYIPGPESTIDAQTSSDSSTLKGHEDHTENSYTLSSDHLIRLIQFNVYRALLSNVCILGLTPEMIDMDIPSPFTTYGPVRVESLLPPSLRPTWLQRSTPHHPYIDIFPIPFIRDRLLLANEDVDDEDLGFDLVGDFAGAGCAHGAGQTAGIIVWGEPWDPFAWEVTEGFAKKWRWMLEGCNEIVESTNYWRAKRGEERLTIDLLSHESELSFDGNTGI